MQIISQIKIDGKWVNQELIPKEKALEIIAETICIAVSNAGFAINGKRKPPEAGKEGQANAQRIYSRSASWNCSGI